MCLKSFVAAATLLSASVVAHADPMDDFTITGGGQNIAFSLPASVTANDPDFYAFVNFGPVMATVNGVASSISTSIELPLGCAPCNTFNLGWNSGTVSEALHLYLPPLYQITYPSMTTETFTFLSGSYTAGTEFPAGGPDYNISITPADTAPTPEPSSIVLLGTGLLGVAGVARRRFLA